MLYDQALLAMAYLETYQVTGENRFAATASAIFTYVLRDMTAPEGGFYSAEDADSEGEEGRFYVWSLAEIKNILGAEDTELFAAAFNVRSAGNFNNEASRQPTGQNILYLNDDSAAGKLENLKKKLAYVREQRVHPHKDDKILTDWNGLMIAALAMGGRILGDETYTKGARRAADFILTQLKKPNGRLMKRYRDGESSLPAHLDDYAYLVWGLLELYETTFNANYLREALNFSTILLKHFHDTETGSFFFTADDSEDLPVRTKDLYDGATPSGNSVCAVNFLRLARITGDTTLEAVTTGIARAFSRELKGMPSGYTQMLNALDFLLGPAVEVVLAGNFQAADTQNLLMRLNSRFIPNKVVVLHAEDNQAAAIEELAPFTRGQISIEGKATAYICRNFACQAPVTDADKMLALLD